MNVVDLAAVRLERAERRRLADLAADRRAPVHSTAFKLLEAALSCYRDAAKARDIVGQDARADYLCASGDKAVAYLNETLEALATL